jgi:hypothetical protein
MVDGMNEPPATVALLIRNALLADALSAILQRARYRVVPTGLEGARVILTTEADVSPADCTRYMRNGTAIVVLLTSASIATYDRYERTGAICAEIGTPAGTLLARVASAFGGDA